MGARQRYNGQMAPGVEDPSDYIGTAANVRCDGPGAELKLEAPQLWSPPGSCCHHGGNRHDSNTSNTQNVRFVLPQVASGPEYKVRVRLPGGLTCTRDAPCTLQWTYMTGNSVDSYPEVFRNCADFKLGSVDGVASTPAPTTTSAPSTVATSAPSTPEPESEPEPASTLPPTETSTHVSTAAPTTSGAPSGDGCIDIQGTSCSHCMASNNVCYAESKSWCDTFSYKWCGSRRLEQQAGTPALRGSRGTAP